MRQFRNLSEETKDKIRKAKTGVALSDYHRESISKGMKKYWSTIPYLNEGAQAANVKNRESQE